MKTTITQFKKGWRWSVWSAGQLLASGFCRTAAAAHNEAAIFVSRQKPTCSPT